MQTTLREARDADAGGLIELIGGCFAEYPGCLLDVDGELPELRAIASYFAKHRGRFWVAHRERRLVGSVGCSPATIDGGLELKKLYVHASARQGGLGSRLVELVECEARERRAKFIDLWSDSRFETAHRFYEKRGYRRGSETRLLHDISDTLEYYFQKDLGVVPARSP